MISATIVARSLGVIGVLGFMAAAANSSIAIQEPTPAPIFGEPNEPAESGKGAKDPAPRELPPPPIDAPPLPTEPEPIKPGSPAEPEPALEIAPGADPEPASPPIKPAPADDEARNPLPPARELPPPSVVSTPIRGASKPEPSPAEPAEPKPAPARRLPAPPVDDDPAEIRQASNAAAADAAPEDPDARARSFVERNRKEAEDQLKALQAEAAQLRGRLARVEAGIRRWESLAEALNRTDERAALAPHAGAPGTRTTRGGIQYVVPGAATGGVIIQSQPVTRADFVPAPLPR